MEENIIEKGSSKKSKIEKEFKYSSWAVDNKMTVFVITAIILVMGYLSYTQMPKENFPEVTIPTIFIGTAYPGNSPEDVEKLISRPIEKELNSITGVDKITSTSQQGFSSIQVEFNFDVTPEQALRKVKDKVDVAKSQPDFPQDLPADPNVFELNFSEMIPILNINLSGDFSLDELNKYAEYLEDEIEAIAQISKVDIRGVNDKEVRVEVDVLKMEAMEMSTTDIAMAIGNENMTISGGDLKVGDFRRNLRVIGEFENIQEIEDVIIKAERQDIVYLRDVANVSFVEKEKESYAREYGEPDDKKTLISGVEYGQPVVMLDVIKRSGENLLEAKVEIDSVLAKATLTTLPKNLRVSITSDQSDATETQVGELVNSIIFGVLLVVGVLLFFLGLRNAIFVGVAIPLSMFLSFAILNFFGVTLNVMVLFSLVLALGMLVDNGIVVVENVYRLMDEGYSAKEAAKKGVGEVAWPIIASTATTLAAFVPLALWPGLMGEFFIFLPVTLMIVLGSSLFVALIINPMLTSVYMRVGEVLVNKKRIYIMVGIMVLLGALFTLGGTIWMGNLLFAGAFLALLNMWVLTPGTKVFQSKALPWMEDKYEAILTFSLAKWRPGAFFIGTLVLLIFSFILVGMVQPKVEFFPANEPQYLNVFIEMPIGTDIEKTNRVTKEIEEKVLEVLYDEDFVADNPLTDDESTEAYLVNSLIAQVGKGTSDPNSGEGGGTNATPNKARIQVSFVKYQDRGKLTTPAVLNRLREELKGYPGVDLVVSKNEAGPPQGAPINIEMASENYDSLIFYADKMKTFINSKNIYGIEELKLDVNKNKPEMPIYIDRAKARRFGLSTGQIGDVMRTALFGKEVSRFKDDKDDYPINIRLQEKYRSDPDLLMDQSVIFRSQSDGQIKKVPISAVARAETATTFSAVKRKNLDRIMTITSNVLEDANANEVVAEIQEKLEDFELPAYVSYKFGGQQEEQAKEMSFLSKALGIAIALIFLIIVAQFNSTSIPVIIMFSVIFSLIGVLLGLIIFKENFVIIMTMIGVISLAGVVVNNAIVLIDYTNLIRDRKKMEYGLAEDQQLPYTEVVKSIIEGGKTRLRPVLLTAITTVLGLVPLAVGLNIDFVSLISEYDPKIYMGGDNVVFWGPMSKTIIYGLVFATFLTLVIVPVMYLLIARLKYRVLYKNVAVIPALEEGNSIPGAKGALDSDLNAL